MLDRFNAVYGASRAVRILACVLLGAAAVLLVSMTGGFPPWAWRFLFATLPQLSTLWAQRGLAILPALLGLVVLSLTLFVLWALILLGAFLILRHWRRARREQRDESGAPYLAPVRTMPEDEEDAAWIPARAAANYAIPAPMPAFAPTSPSLSTVPTMPAVSAMPKTQRNVRYDLPFRADPAVAAVAKAPTAPMRPVPVATVDASPRGAPGSRLYLEVGSALDAGIKRKGLPNEDSILALATFPSARLTVEPVGLFIIADGMGGHGNGQEASRLAIQSMHSALELALVDGPEDDIYEELLAEAVHTANLAIYQRNRQKSANMGTTLSAALVIGETAYIANVGDSRTYLYRESEGLTQITRDHSTVARLVESGAITRQDIYTHPKRNEIYRCLGDSASVKVDTFTVPLEAGDLLLLCSDGLWEMARDEGIEEILADSYPDGDASDLCDQLTRAALDGGGKDNISVIAVYVRED